MPAYVVSHIDVFDLDAYEEYKPLATETVDRHGGRYLARGGTAQAIEGEWFPRVVVIEFPSYDEALGWYHSEDYRPALDLRLRCAKSHVVIVDGVAPV